MCIHVRLFGHVTTTLLVALLTAAPVFAQQGTANGEWRHYNGDIGSTKYAPLDQINRDNVGTLRIAWSRPSVDPSIPREGTRPQLREHSPRDSPHGRWHPL